MRKFLASLLFLLIFFYSSDSQVSTTSPYNNVLPSVLNSAGGSYDNPANYNRYEWSIGELLLIQAFALTDSSLFLTQGLLQPCTEKIGLSPFTVIFEAGDYKLFPNPTSGKFELNFFVRSTGQMSLQLINATGQLLQKRTYQYDGCCRIELFDLSRYPDGVYYVVADLITNIQRGDGLIWHKHSGIKVIKLSPQ